MTEFTQAEYEKYSKQLDALESKQSSSLLRRFKDKVLSLVKSEDEMQDMRESRKKNRRVLGGKHYSLLKRVEAMEAAMLREGK